MPYSQTLEEMASSYEADIEINTHFTGEEKTAVGEIVKEGGPSGSKVLDDGMYIGVAQKPTGFSIKSILNNESDNSSTSNKKRKFGKFNNFNHVLYQFYTNFIIFYCFLY